MYTLSFLEWFTDFSFSAIWNKLAEWFEGLVQKVVDILPDSPFQVAQSTLDTVKEYMAYVNWVVPFGTCLKIFLAWCTAVGVYYGVQAILRFLKVAGQ